MNIQIYEAMKKLICLSIFAYLLATSVAFAKSANALVFLVDSTACDSLQTTFTGGNSQKGNMFDVSNIYSNGGITVRGFDVNLTGTCGFDIFYRPGSYVNFENSSVGWIQVAHYDTLHAHAAGTATPVLLTNPVTIPASTTYAFYLTTNNSTTANVKYTVGTSAGSALATDGKIFILEGCGIKYPFSGTPYTPRDFNGRLLYCYTPVGIDELTSSKITTTVAPNPFQSAAMVSIQGYTPHNSTLIITDILGNRVNELKNINSPQVPIDKGKLSNGMYYYQLLNGSQLLSTGKIIIE